MSAPASPDLRTAGPGSDPPGALLAPLAADGTVHLDALPRGSSGGEIAIADAPQGARNVANKIGPEWAWRLLSGEGWTLRQGSGPPRGNGTRPKLAILDACASVTLRAVAIDPGFPAVTHHVVIVWSLVYRAGKWKAEQGSIWTTEPRPGGGRWQTFPPVDVGVTAAKALLSTVPDVAEVDTVRALALAAREAEAGEPIDRPVSTDDE